MENRTISLTLSSAFCAADWSLCHRTASFLADSLGAHLAAGAREEHLQRHVETVDAVNFILNELLENALKHKQAGGLTVTIQLGGGEVCCGVSHRIAPEAAARLRQELRKLTRAKPHELFLQRVEANAVGHGSGLGCLLLLADYGARMSWRLEAVSPNTTCLTTQAQLPI